MPAWLVRLAGYPETVTPTIRQQDRCVRPTTPEGWAAFAAGITERSSSLDGTLVDCSSTMVATVLLVLVEAQHTLMKLRVHPVCWQDEDA